MKAMRSRWRGSMLAWILNTKPLNLVPRRLPRRARASPVAAAPVRNRVKFAAFPDAEIADRRTEKHRGLAAGEILLQVELGGRAAHQFDFLAKCSRIAQQFRASSLPDPAMTQFSPTRPLAGLYTWIRSRSGGRRP